MKIKLYFYHEQWIFDKQGNIVAWPIKMQEELTGSRLRIFLCEHEVEVLDVELLSEVEIKQIMVDGLRQQKTELQAENHIKLKEIDEKIQQLLCVEMKSEEIKP